jgi:hypothetical protein
MLPSRTEINIYPIRQKILSHKWIIFCISSVHQKPDSLSLLHCTECQTTRAGQWHTLHTVWKLYCLQLLSSKGHREWEQQVAWRTLISDLCVRERQGCSLVTQPLSVHLSEILFDLSLQGEQKPQSSHLRNVELWCRTSKSLSQKQNLWWNWKLEAGL